jgi:hypothetical protein
VQAAVRQAWRARRRRPVVASPSDRGKPLTIIRFEKEPKSRHPCDFIRAKRPGLVRHLRTDVKFGGSANPQPRLPRHPACSRRARAAARRARTRKRPKTMGTDVMRVRTRTDGDLFRAMVSDRKRAVSCQATFRSGDRESGDRSRRTILETSSPHASTGDRSP